MQIFDAASALKSWLEDQPVPSSHTRYMITDPPYFGVGRFSVSNAKKKGTTARDLGFDSLSPELFDTLLRISEHTTGGCVFSSLQGTQTWVDGLWGNGFEVDVTVWVRWSMPQLSGDRPPSGAESIISYGGMVGKLPDIMTHKCMRGKSRCAEKPDGKHPAQKPVPLIREIVGCTPTAAYIIDPCFGSGVVGREAMSAGRGFAGAEIDPMWRASLEATK